MDHPSIIGDELASPILSGSRQCLQEIWNTFLAKDLKVSQGQDMNIDSVLSILKRRRVQYFTRTIVLVICWGYIQSSVCSYYQREEGRKVINIWLYSKQFKRMSKILYDLIIIHCTTLRALCLTCSKHSLNSTSSIFTINNQFWFWEISFQQVRIPQA